MLVHDFVDEVEFLESFYEYEEACVASAKSVCCLELGDCYVKWRVKKELQCVWFSFFYDEVSFRGSVVWCFCR